MPPVNAQQGFHAFGDVLFPSEAQEPILAKPVRDALLEWLTEVWAEEELEAVNLKPRKKALFTGPPGVGKTTLAHHLSARIGLPMVVVRSERLIGSHIGESSRNIGALFDLAAISEPAVLFVDEFDSIGLKRREATQGAEDERNSWVNTLLQRIERHDGFLIAATNFGEQVDEAIWRRFDLQIALQLPGQGERERILARYLAPYTLPAPALVAFANAFGGAAPALMRQFCEGLKRCLIVGPKVGWNMDKPAVIQRIIASVAPHPDLQRPRLWLRGAQDDAVAALPWPLEAGERKEARAA